MCNCNQERSQYSSGNDPLLRGMVKVQLTEDDPLVFSGNVTGRMYVFRNLHDINWVDKRDVLSMDKIDRLQVFL